jgi:hypothetical protein
MGDEHVSPYVAKSFGMGKDVNLFLLMSLLPDMFDQKSILHTCDIIFTGMLATPRLV